MKRITTLLLSLLLLCMAAPSFATESTGTLTTATFTSTTAEIPNQERGFYGLLTYAGTTFELNQATSAAITDTFNGGYRLAIAVLNLNAYAGTDTIDDAFIAAINGKFALVRAGHIKVILRITYNYDSSGTDTTVARITLHMQRLSKLLTENADVIAYLQDGLVGDYGEWYHSVTFGTGFSVAAQGANMRLIHQAVRASISGRTYQAIRYPKFPYSWYPSQLTATSAFSGSEQAMTAIHNDCFMSSDNDVGTFQSNTLSPVSSNPERLRLSQDTNWHPYGGETCDGFTPTRFTCSTTSGILFDGPTYHLTYLNHSFSTVFINAITSGGCYAQVMRMLGYRFQYDAISHQATANAGQTMTFNIDMRNYGWSRIFSERRVQVRLYPTGTTTTPSTSAMSAPDLRLLPPQATSSTRIPVKGLIAPSSGTYDVALCIPDWWANLVSIPDYNVRNANANSGGQTWNGTIGCWITGTHVTVP
jgi:hypothetical protein